MEILRGLREKEREGQRLPWSTGGRGGKPPRLNDHYKKLWQEMCEFLEAHSNNSPNHSSGMTFFQLNLYFFNKFKINNSEKITIFPLEKSQFKINL